MAIDPNDQTTWPYYNLMLTYTITFQLTVGHRDRDRP